MIALQQHRASPRADGHASTLPDALQELERAFDELDVMCSHSRDLLEHRARVEAEHERTRRRYQALFDGARLKRFEGESGRAELWWVFQLEPTSSKSSPTTA